MGRAVSVVIPARDSQNSIRHTIQSLARQTRRPDEVIVVAGSNDSTGAAIEDYVDRGFVRIMKVDPPARFVRDAHWKRWVGAKSSKGDVIFFTDSGVIVEENAISRALELMGRYNAMVVAGVVPSWLGEASHFVAKVQDKGLVTNYPKFPEIGFLTESNFGRSESLPVTGVLFMAREAFESIQDDFGVEFSSRASTYDDYVTAWLIVREGITIVVTNTVVAYHKPRLSLKNYVKEISRSGQSAAVMRCQYPECPFGRRRLLQTLAVWGVAVVSLITAIVSVVAFGPAAILVMTGLAVGGYIVLGVANAVRARDLWGFLIPPLTTLLIFTFVIHFTKGWAWMKQDRPDPQKVLEYLQIR